ncbi:MAG: fibronectin type III domain-containing protein [Opitutaceae bacterium]
MRIPPISSATDQKADFRISRAYSDSILVAVLGVLATLHVVSSGLSAEEIKLTWTDRSRIETAYHIEREIAGFDGFEELPTELGANTESYTYDDPTQGGQLRFRVFASNEYGPSGYSNLASTIPPQTMIEDTPFDLMLFTDGHPVTNWGSYEPRTDGEWQSAVSLAVSHQQGSGGIPGQAYFDDISIYDGEGNRIGFEDFEDNGVGDYPGNWAINPDWPWSEPFNSVQADPVSPDEDRTFFLAGNGSSVTGSFLPGSYDSEAIAVEFRIYLPGSNGIGGNPAYFIFGGASAIAYVNDDRSVSVRLGHDENTALDGLSLDRWYQIRMELKPETGVARLVLVGETRVFDQENLGLQMAIDGFSLVSNLLFAPAERADTRILTISPQADAFGSTLVTIDLIAGDERLAKIFKLGIAPVNDPPSIGVLSEQAMLEDNVKVVPLPVSDRDTDLSELKVIAAAAEADLFSSLTADYIDGEGWVLSMVPVANRNGKTEIDVTVDDGEFEVASSFLVEVISVPDAPEFVAYPESLTTTQGSFSFAFAVEVGDVDTLSESLTIVPSMEDSDLITAYNVIPGQTDGEFLVSMVLDPNWSGETILLLVVTDETGESAQVDIELIVEPGPRVFFGSIGESGICALYIDSGGVGTFLGWNPSGHDVYFSEGFGVGMDGSFVVGGNPNGVGALSGEIVGFGVSGVLGPMDIVFSGQQLAIGGPTSGFIGGYLGFLNDLSGGIGRLIVGPDGRALAVLESNSDSVSDGAWVGVDAEGLLSGIWLDSPMFEMRLDPLMRRFTGDAEFAGLHWAVAATQDPNARASRMVNLSTRSWSGMGPEAIIAGFVVEGAGPIDLLVRGIGPGLIRYGVNPVLGNPELVLRDGGGVIALNKDWDLNPDPEFLTDLAGQLGGFPLDPGSGDSALFSELGTGRFTAVVRPDGDTNGVALVELYDATFGGESQLANLSTRLVLRPSTAGTLGFVISGTTRVQVLIRAIGPGLSSYGVEGVLPDPMLRVFDQADPQAPFLSNDDWWDPDEGLIQAVSAKVGAFPLESGSPDAVVLVWLDPGVYSAKASDADGAGGAVLTELYVVP